MAMQWRPGNEAYLQFEALRREYDSARLTPAGSWQRLGLRPRTLLRALRDLAGRGGPEE